MGRNKVSADGIELVYDTFGDEADPPLLLIMGLGVPRFGWDDRFCRALTERGLWVIRFDNRDVGESTHIHAAARPDLAAGALGRHLIRHLPGRGHGRRHSRSARRTRSRVGARRRRLVGGHDRSDARYRHPGRVRSLTSVMSTVGPNVGPPRQAALEALLAPPARTPAEHEQRALDTWHVIGSPGFSLDEDRLRALARRIWDAGYDADGVARQLLAIVASGDRTETLRSVEVPTLVIHGDCDPLLQPEGGRATAEAIAGAELDMVEGMGHDLPVELYERFADRIAGLVRRAEAGVPAASS